MLVLTSGFSIPPHKAISTGSNIKDVTTTSSEVNKDDLYQRIEAYNEQFKIEPIDAKVDRIWKAMPGYNGLSVNIKASYKKMKKSGDI